MNLMRASAKGDLETVKQLLNEGADVNATDMHGRTALIEASWSGSLEVAEFLIKKGADVNASDSAGYTALMRASEEGHLPVVKFLIKNGADVNARGKVRGTTPLMLAAENGHKKIIGLLIDNGANVNAIDQYEETALARAYRTNQIEAAELIESKGGRGKPERNTFSTSNEELKPYTKATVPQWSAAATEDFGFDEEAPVDGFEEE
ncbi:MAG: ankyrin repeat domain-containing protein [Fibrobacter sp.]|nr:ankyrin repeat domain-containing protein [Fibrobacter sp.]